ncbi:MAG TPA: iron uptake system protein EfeO [Acidimicrobiales bacterium]|jgi:iron uptake system component EfeO
MTAVPSSARRRSAIAVLALTGFGLLGVACAKTETDSGSATGAGQVKVTLTDAGCSASPAKAKSGQVEFLVSNKNSSRVSETELRTGNLNSILGERENLTPGLSGSFKLNLASGSYKLYCPGAKQDTWDFTVTKGAKVADWHDNPALVKLTTQYSDYVEAQVALLQKNTATFVADVKAGDMAKAQQDYAPARIHYETIEPVAESFGDLDPLLDNRADDVVPQKLTGFHRLEYAIWTQKSLKGMAPVADQLMANITKLKNLVTKKAGTYVPNEITAGAADLMNEVMTSKITGEEERYSHIDLVDFKANFDGTMEIVNLAKPILGQSDPALVTTLTAEANAVTQALNVYAQKPGFLNTGYAEWGYVKDPNTTITTVQRRALANAVKPFVADLGQISVKVTV